MLKEHGLEGYRRYNYASGRLDMNQSLASKEARKAMKKAYRNMILHNPEIYFKQQANFFCIAMGYDIPYLLDNYVGNGAGYGPWTFNMWDIGIADYFSHNSIVKWQENTRRQNLATKIDKWFTDYSDLWKKNKILRWLNILVIVVNFVIALYEFIKSIVQRKVSVFLIPAATLFVQILAIASVMPAPFYFYLRTYYYCSLLMILIYIPALKVIKRSETERPAT